MLELLRRLRFLFRRESFERDLEEEMRHHLALKSEAQSPNAAARHFGNVTLLKENSRSMWTFPLFEQLGQDIRYAFRAMAANPLFTATAALSLALGIGANTAIYSFMDAILMRALPVPHPEQLAVFKWSSKGRPGVIRSLNGSNRRDRKTNVSTSPNFPFAAADVFTADRDVVTALFAYAYTQTFNLNVAGRAEAAGGCPISGNFYSGLGIVPAAGRLISPDDDRTGAPLTGVLAYAYWQRRFNSDPAVIGQTILANNLPITIVGVSAPGFYGLDPAVHPDFFFPLHALPLFSPNPARDEKNRFFDNHFYWLEMMARLRPGVSLAQAQAAFAPQFHHFAESTATSEKERQIFPDLWLDAGSSGLDSLRQRYSEPLRVLMAMVALILTIACANMANLLLARSSARRREMAIRLSMGAGRWRIVRQLLTESILLSLTGGALGLIFAYWGIQSITWLIANGEENFTLHAELNWPVLAFTFALSLLAGLVFGLAPALQSTGFDLTPALKESKSGASHARRSALRPGLGSALVVAQIAISLILVIAAGVFVRNLVNLNTADLGFNRGNVLLFSLNARDAGYQDEAAARFFTGVHDRIRQLPGVRGAGLSNFPLVAQYINDDSVRVPGAPPVVGGHDNASLLHIDPDFLATMEIPVLMGRGFETRDMSARNTALVNQTFVSAFLSGESPLGHHVLVGGAPNPQDFEIVGVTRDAHYNSIQEVVPATVYLPFTQNQPLSRMYFAVRTAGDPMAMVNPIREIVRQADNKVVFAGVITQSRRIEQTISQQRTFADLGTCFAALAMLIACVGLYGAMAYAVARRTSEIGIRIALGAKRGLILWMVLRQVLLLAAVGLVIGFYVARSLSHWIASYLFGMKPNDPIAIVAAIAILLAAALAAGFIPAWRASRIHPMTALRYE